ncbi:GLUG motif-containing protein [Paenibacillus albidus]|uniref:GLUG motif-containing protein n=1 Tax=Paenibacillus albidus TaxID=2041023 RepID=UPI0016666897|nr:GLUG motif-containing protein [Paenibacillus albidus]
MIGLVPLQVLAGSQDTMKGSGTEADPYVILTLEHLNEMRNNLSAHYMLGADLNASETADWNSGEGFIPIGGNGNDSSQFTGVFDGKGHVISDLTINRPLTHSIGLFGIIGPDGVVRNVGLAGGSITGKSHTGGLAGRNYGTVDQSYVASVVSSAAGTVGGLVGYNGSGSEVTSSYAAGSVSGGNYVGGLVGRNDDTVSASYATGTVDGANIVGGLIGDNEGGTVTQSYATGAVSGSGDHVGGLLGYNISAFVSQSYATGSVRGNVAVGGLVGGTDFGLISQSYATGDVSGGSFAGGLIGINGFGELNTSFWDTETSGQSSACGYDTGICSASGLTTPQALTQADYSGWDFTNDWFMLEGATRPFLRSEYSATISNTHQLQLMALDLENHYTLAKNLDFGTTFTDTSRSDMWATRTGGGMVTGSGFVPIGWNGLSFSGIFDGQGRKISHLTIHRPQSSDIGPFGSVRPSGVVKNIGLDSAAVTGNIAVGGVIGKTLGTVSNAYYIGSVNGMNFVGGLVGQTSGGTVSESFAAGSVDGHTGVGGLIGESCAEVSEAYAAGTVTGDMYTGGLVGNNQPGGTVSEGFYDSQTTRQSDDGKGHPTTTAQMKRQSTFKLWDFTDTWMIEEGTAYPVLQAAADSRGLDMAPPTIVSAKVEDEHPDSVIVMIDEEISISEPDGITIEVDGRDVPVTNLNLSEPKVVSFTVNQAVEPEQEVSISYDGQLGNIVDAAHNPLDNFAHRTVENNLTRLEAPANLTATADDSRISLHWDSVTKADSYNIYMSTASGVYSELPAATTTGATYSVTGLTYGTYYFTVRSSNAKEDSDYSAEVKASLQDLLPPTVGITMKTADGIDYEDHSWTNQNVTVTASAADADSGLASFTYSVDGGVTWSPYTSDIVLQGDNVYLIVFKAVDAAGNEAVEGRTVKISSSGLMLTPSLTKSDGSAIRAEHGRTPALR